MPERLTQTVDIETPELVVVSYTIAGLGSRVYAALIDLAISIVLMIGVIVGLALMSRNSPFETGASARPSSSSAWAVAILFIMQFVVLWGYYLLFEGLADGQTQFRQAVPSTSRRTRWRLLGGLSPRRPCEISCASSS